jgi:hypothetical protein
VMTLLRKEVKNGNWYEIWTIWVSKKL